MDLLADPEFLGSVFVMIIIGIITAVAIAIITILLKAKK
jgi:ABC-type uncharacterized transport system permease subunit